MEIVIRLLTFIVIAFIFAFLYVNLIDILSKKIKEFENTARFY